MITIAMVASHPAGVRGLKRLVPVVRGAGVPVAPRRGAWIETGLPLIFGTEGDKSHPAGVRGLKRSND